MGGGGHSFYQRHVNTCSPLTLLFVDKAPLTSRHFKMTTKRTIFLRFKTIPLLK